ncbi:MAG TPA: hypothetical protein VI356_07545 [Myxococcales bacterium]
MGELAFDEIVVPTASGARTALVVTPRARILLGAVRLAALRAAQRGGEIDDALFLRVKACARPPSAVIFRAKSEDGQGWWGFDPRLPDLDARDLAKRLARTHMESHRRLFGAGVLAVVHTDYGTREAALFRAVEAELAQEEEERAASGNSRDAAVAQLNLWTLRTLTFTYTLKASKVISDLLPATIVMLERTAPIVKQMLAAAGSETAG